MTFARLFPLQAAIFALASVGVYACSATGGGSQFGQGGAGGSGSPSAGPGGGFTQGSGDSSGDGLFDAGAGSSGSTGSGGDGCSAEAQFVYVVDENKAFYKFDPPSLTFTLIGTLNCPSIFSPYSMSVSRDAVAWVVYSDGNLFQVDAKTAACKATSYKPGQSGFTTFGMGFSTNAPGSAAETLYVSDSTVGAGSTKGLAKIDLTTMILTPVGKYDKVTARAEMTGTGDARLFGAFEGTPYEVDEISKPDAKILSQAPQNAIQYAPGSSNFAFAFWGGDFYLFVGPGTKTDVFKYEPSKGTTTLVKTDATKVIVGAGVSTCAPTKPPA